MTRLMRWILVTTFGLYLPLTLAATGSDSISFLPTTSTNAPSIILIDSGRADYNYSGSHTGAGNLFLSSCSNGLCNAYFYTTPGITCPVNMDAYVLASPYKMVMQTGFGAVCVKSTSAGDNSNYLVNVQETSALSSAQGSNPWGYPVTVSSTSLAVSFNWAVYCYPRGQAPGYDTTCSKSTNATLLPIIWDEGFYYHTINSEWAVFSTNRICPNDYQPYVTTNPQSVSNVYSNEMLEGFGVCVHAVVQDTSSVSNPYVYQVYAFASKIYVTPNNSISYYRTMCASSDTNACLWSYDWIYEWFYNYYPPYINQTPTYTDPNNYGLSSPFYSPPSVGTIHWVLYCYPPGATLPDDYSYCQQGNDPY